ncbi:MAG TPA: riboflavin synthase [Streptosporangiaceae bacterium]|nr:riboflavin synthase [Streptosporangiaceae bacterium]
MFTGIVEELGEVAGLERLGDSARLAVRGPLVAAAAAPGNSIAVNGVCLTVTRSGDGEFTADVMGETLDRTGLGALATGAPVNLERPVRAGGGLDGHIVQGHVDGTGVIVDSRPAERWQVLRISLPAGLARYVAYKGSVAVDGVSLTVSDVSGNTGALADGADSWFEVSLIPETMARTTLGAAAAGSMVNIEVDVIAKYVERLLAGGESR